jgi:hypothetical protein
MDITALVRTPIVIFALLLAVAACGPSKPAGPTPEDLKRQAEQTELQRLRAAEQERVAKEEAERKVAEEAKRQQEAVALPPEFGQPKPPAAAAKAPSGAAPAAGAPPAAAAPAPTAAAASAAVAGVASAETSAAASSSAGTRAGAASTVAPLIASSAAGTSEAPTVPYDQAFPPIPDRLLRVAVVSAPSQANVAERIGTMLSVTERDRLENALGMGLQIAYLSQAERDPKLQTRIQYREKFLQAAVRLASVIPQAQKVERMTESDANRMGVDVMIQVGTDLH